MERTIICISRQYGSGGREIGEAVAKKLGIPCYDKCLIQKAAQEAGLSETAVAEYDEKGEDFGIAVSGNPFADTAALGEAFYSEEARVFEAERRAILELAEKGDCVIIGRCASAILRAAGYRPLSVFIYADSADRAKRIAARNNLDEKRALHKAQKVDRMRKHHFDFYADTLFGSIIFQQLYNIADSFVAGKFISDNALAAVGNSYEITLIFIAFAFGCNIACSVLAALFFGAKQYNDLKTTVYTALISSCVICAVLMLVGTLCCDSLLRLIKTPEEVFADSKLYLDIYIYGLPFVFL